MTSAVMKEKATTLTGDKQTHNVVYIYILYTFTYV